MQYFLTPFAKRMESWAWWEGAFSPQELDFLQAQAQNAQQDATVGGDENGGVNPSIRRSQVAWMRNSADTAWVFERLAGVAVRSNAENFRLDLTGFGEQLQLTTYRDTDSGTYGWHQDFNGSISRKLSIVMQLSDPADYDGGDLQIFTSAVPTTVPKKRGLIALFPSFAVHQVTPVIRGSRQSLVAWVSGPSFK